MCFIGKMCYPPTNCPNIPIYPYLAFFYVIPDEGGPYLEACPPNSYKIWVPHVKICKGSPEQIGRVNKTNTNITISIQNNMEEDYFIANLFSNKFSEFLIIWSNSVCILPNQWEVFNYYISKFSLILPPSLCQYCQQRKPWPTPLHNRRWVSNFKNMLFYYNKECIFGFVAIFVEISERNS